MPSYLLNYSTLSGSDTGWGTNAFRQLGLFKVQLVVDIAVLLTLGALVCGVRAAGGRALAPPARSPFAAAHTLLPMIAWKQWLVCIVPQCVQSGAGTRYRARTLGGRVTRSVEDTCHSLLETGPWMREHERTMPRRGCLPHVKPGGHEAWRSREDGRMNSHS